MAMALRTGTAPIAAIQFQLLWFWAGGPGVHAQTAPEEALDIPLVAVAWDAGCLTRDECAVIAAAFRGQPQAVWTQQALASELDPSRASRAVDCLRLLPEWQEVFLKAALAPGRRPGSSLRVRGDVTSVTPGMNVTYRSKGKDGGDVGCRAALWGEKVEVEAAHAKFGGLRGTWWCGTMAAAYGQGLVLWTPSPFDDIGGIEGSHRIGRGIRSVSYRQRGVWNGLAWQRNQSFARRGRPHWCMFGKTWPEQKGTAALGGKLGSLEWAGRMQELKEGGWTGLVGVNGKGGGNGWSLRWAVARFREGWEGRFSALKTWSAIWEGHVQLERSHPQHPRWRSGEVRSTMLDPESLPGILWKGGVAFKGTWDGWLRLEARWWGPPPHRLRRRTSVRIERHDHRLDFKVIMEPGESLQTATTRGPFGGGHWLASWRKLHSSEALGAPIWRWCISASGQNNTVGMALAFMVSWRMPSLGRWRLGVAQSWADEGAPVRHVQGWDGRPSEPFSKTGFKAYLRWASDNGVWRLGMRTGWSGVTDFNETGNFSWGIHAFRVEFKPSWSSERQG